MLLLLTNNNYLQTLTIQQHSEKPRAKTRILHISEPEVIFVFYFFVVFISFFFLAALEYKFFVDSQATIFNECGSSHNAKG